MRPLSNPYAVRRHITVMFRLGAQCLRTEPETLSPVQAMTTVACHRLRPKQGLHIMDIVLLGTGALFFGVSFAYIKFCSSI